MIKKIKDLTKTEVKIICENARSCYSCPLNFASYSYICVGYLIVTDANITIYENRSIEYGTLHI